MSRHRIRYKLLFVKTIKHRLAWPLFDRIKLDLSAQRTKLLADHILHALRQMVATGFMVLDTENTVTPNGTTVLNACTVFVERNRMVGHFIVS